MMIVIQAGDTLAAYAAQYPTVAAQRPHQCPKCQTEGRMQGFGSYPRKPLLATPALPLLLKIRRWRCAVCKATTSLLPDVLHRHRQYAWAVIGEALLRRVLLGQTWPQIQAALNGLPADASPAPSLDSLRRWQAALARQAEVWLVRVLALLATLRPGAAQLDAHGQPARSAAQQLLLAFGALASWLLPLGTPAAGAQVAAVRAGWRWGWNASVGRLV